MAKSYTGDTERWKSVLEAAKVESDLDRKHWNKVKTQYHQLDQILETLPDERVKECMVPISKVAFCPGRLIHTNEITALLGDGYFAEVSAKTARKLVEHRLEMIEERLDKTETAATQIFERQNQMEELNNDIIKEDLDEEFESEQEKKKSEKRFEESKIEEIRRQQLEKLNTMKQKWKEPIIKPPKYKPKEDKQNSSNDKKHIAFNETLEDVCSPESVDNIHLDSAGSESDPEEPLRIEFRWTKMSQPIFSENGYLTPWDIGHNYKKRVQNRKKSILKVHDNINKANELARLEYSNQPIRSSGASGALLTNEASNSKIISDQKIPAKNTAMTDAIIERKNVPDKNVPSSQPIKEPKKRVSLFKQRRQKM